MVRLQFIPQQNVTAATAVTSAASLVSLGTLAGKVVSPVTPDKVMFRSRSIWTLELDTKVNTKVRNHEENGYYRFHIEDTTKTLYYANRALHAL